jgi:hypothetical protein
VATVRRTTSVAAGLAGVLSAGVLVAGAAPASASPAQPAAGDFVVEVAFTTADFSDVGQTCRVSIDATLTFTGTLTGVATGELSALVLAPCADAQGAQPGAFRDVFRLEGAFTGTVDGERTTGALTYAGVTRPGGAIDAQIRLSGPVRAALQADAAVGVGGTYAGVAH